MITKLTKKQQEKIPVYLDKWLKFGLRTKTIDRNKSKAAVLLEKLMFWLERKKFISSKWRTK